MNAKCEMVVFMLIVPDLSICDKQNIVKVVAFISGLQAMKKYLKLRKHTFQNIHISLNTSSHKHQLEYVHSICSIDAFRALIFTTFSTVLTLMCFRCIPFVFRSELAHSWRRLNSDWNTNEQTLKSVFIHIVFVFQRSISTLQSPKM